MYIFSATLAVTGEKNMKNKESIYTPHKIYRVFQSFILLKRILVKLLLLAYLQNGDAM